MVPPRTGNKPRIDTNMHDTSTSSRPAAVGDILVTWAHPTAGIRVEICVDEPPIHAASGVDAPPACAVTGTLYIDGDNVPPSMVARVEVLGEALGREWGYQRSPCGAQSRVRDCRKVGPAIGPLLADVTAALSAAYSALGAVHDAHVASVARLASERAAAYAAWPVAVVAS